MVYGILKLLNFAHGEVFMIGAFFGYGVLIGLGGATTRSCRSVSSSCSCSWPSMLGSGLLGVTIERFAYRPLRNARIAP